MNAFWPYLLLLLSVALEGEVAILIGAGAAAGGYLNLPAVFITAVFGNLLSDFCWYALGYYGGIDWLIRKMKWTGITPKMLDMLIGKIQQDVNKLLAFAKVTNWMTIPALIATGVAQVPWRRWVLLVFVSNFLVAAIMVPLGYYATFNLLQFQKGMTSIALGFTLVFIIVAIFYIRRHLSRRNPPADLADGAPHKGRA